MVMNDTQINCKGLNQSRLINLCISKGIEINNLNKISHSEMEFSLNDKNLKKFNSLDLSNYDISIKQIGGLKKLKNIFVYRIGLIIGLIISIMMMIFINNRLLHVEVYGLTSIDKDKIVDSIKDYGINKFSLMNFDKDKLEKYLSERYDFSLVSIAIKGNTLLISVKEELRHNDSGTAIISPYNMIITDITVFAGTTYLKAGDIVYKGDVLVYPYSIVNGEEILVQPKAQIFADVFTTASHTYLSNETIKTRTGNYRIINSSIYLGKIKLFETEKENNYSLYEIETKNTLVTEYFLPINLKKTISYELKEIEIERNFEKDKDSVVNKVINEAYSKLEKTLIVNDEKIDILQVDNGYLINVYLKSDITLNYKD